MGELVDKWCWQDKTQLLAKNLFQWPFIHHNSHIDTPGTELGPPRWEGGDYPPVSQHGPFALITVNHRAEQMESKRPFHLFPMECINFSCEFFRNVKPISGFFNTFVRAPEAVHNNEASGCGLRRTLF